MKKQMKWLLAALALAALATPAFAVTADMNGTLAVRGIMTNNLDGNDKVDDSTQGFDQRFRIWTNAAANENVKAVFGIEIDNVWGRVKSKSTATGSGAGVGFDESGNGTGNKEVGTVGSDAKAEIEIKHLYLDFKIPSLGANVKAGVQPFNLGRGLIINDDAAGLSLSIPCQVNPANVISLYWVKTSEGDFSNSRTDGDFYAAKYSTKVADVTIAPYAGYYTAGSDSLTAVGVDAAYFGVDVDGKVGPFGYGVTALYNNWNGTDTSTKSVDGDALALWAKGTLAVADTTLSLEAARYGDKDNGGSFLSVRDSIAASGPSNNFSEIITGGMYTTNTGLNANLGGATNTYATNFLYAKIGVAQKLSDTMKVSAYLMHIEQAADVGKNDAITYGQEVDAYFDYTIAPGLGLNFMAAYLLADDDFGAVKDNPTTTTVNEYVKGGDNAYKLATSLNYKF